MVWCPFFLRRKSCLPRLKTQPAAHRTVVADYLSVKSVTSDRSEECLQDRRTPIGRKYEGPSVTVATLNVTVCAIRLLNWDVA